jgi:hypothetical protein
MLKKFGILAACLTLGLVVGCSDTGTKTEAPKTEPAKTEAPAKPEAGKEATPPAKEEAKPDAGKTETAPAPAPKTDAK